MAYKSKKEYVIFGKVGNSKYEDLLVSESAGISSLEEAKKAIKYLEEKYNCKECRVLTFDANEKPDFVNTIIRKNSKKRK